MTYEQFVRDFWGHIKRLAVEPMFSMGELVMLLALLVNTFPRWFNAATLFLWILWRFTARAKGAPPHLAEALVTMTSPAVRYLMENDEAMTDVRAAQADRNPKGGNVVPSRSDESPVPEGDAPE